MALNEVVGLLIEFLEDAQVYNSFLALEFFCIFSGGSAGQHAVVQVMT